MDQQITLETIDRKIDSLQTLLIKLFDLLYGEKKRQSQEKEDKDSLVSMPPISNTDAARLLLISTRQLQRVRRKYRLIWESRGRCVYYHISPIIKAIRAFNLQWSQSVLDSLIANHKRLP